MPNPKTPLAKARLTGADRNHPSRFRNRTELDGGGAVGPAPDYLSDDAKRFWDTFVSELPWLTKADRALLASASLLRAQVIASQGEVTGALIREYRSHLGALGSGPVARQRVSQVPDEDQDDPFSVFGGPQ